MAKQKKLFKKIRVRKHTSYAEYCKDVWDCNGNDFFVALSFPLANLIILLSFMIIPICYIFDYEIRYEEV